MDVQLTIRNFVVVVEEFYTIKFADLIGAIKCSINVAVAGNSSRRAISAGVLPLLSLAFGSAPASMRALMISLGAPPLAAQCNAFHLYCYSIVCCVSFAIKSLSLAIKV
jgi:hypothetical protein